MGEVYWLGGGPGSAGAAIASLGVRSRWVDQIHRLGDGVVGLPPEFALTPAYCWPEENGQDHALLQLCERALLSGEVDLLLLAQGGAASALLGTPGAVGRFNLLPRARLAARWTERSQAESAAWPAELAAWLEQAGFDPTEIAVLSLPGGESQATGAFPQAEALTLPNPLLARLGDLVRRLEETGGHTGLLLSRPDGRRALATLVERI